MRQNHYYYDQQKKFAATPFVSPLSEKWSSLIQSRYNSKIASDRARFNYFDYRRFGKDTTTTYFAAIFLNGIFGSECLRETTPPWLRMEERAANYGRVDLNEMVLLNCERNYELRNTRRVWTRTKLDQRRNWGINLDLRTRWPETEKIRFDAPTQLYWKEGMPTLRMFFFSFRYF